MKGYCENCKKQVQGVKKPFSFLCGWLTCWIPYIIYRILLVGKNRCPICGLRLRWRK